MISNKSAFTILLLAVLSFYSYGQEKPIGDFTLKVSAEDRFFFSKGLYEGQEKNFLSLAVQPEYSIQWHEEKFLFQGEFVWQV